MKKLLVAAAVTGLVGTANAQSAFEGFYGQIATGYENNSIQSSQTTFTTTPNINAAPYNNPSISFGNVPLIAGLGYTFSISNQFTLGIGADYSFITSKSGNTTSTPTAAGDDPATGYTKVSNRMNVYLTPGLVIDKNSLAYLKVGYSGQKVENFDTATNASLGSANVSGFILGLGYKQVISGGFYGFGEANYMSYGKKTISDSGACNSLCSSYTASTPTSSSAYNFLVGVGYRF
jgi:outer membrane immunogenic protein